MRRWCFLLCSLLILITTLLGVTVVELTRLNDELLGVVYQYRFELQQVENDLLDYELRLLELTNK